MSLKPSDFSNVLFDWQRPVYRKIGLDPYATIEGATYTDNFNLLGWTYWPDSGKIQFKTIENIVVFNGVIKTVGDFEKAIKRADKKCVAPDGINP